MTGQHMGSSLGTMKRGLIAIVTCALIGLSGCGEGKSGAKDPDPPSGTNAPSTSSAGEDSTDSTEEPEESEEVEVNPRFGEAYTWENGLTVTVSPPTPFKSSYAKDLPELRFTVTVVNTTGANFDPVGMSFTMQSGNVEAEEIYDSAKGLNGTPSTTLLEGREAMFDIGFTVTNPADLVMEVSSGDFDLANVIYVS